MVRYRSQVITRRFYFKKSRATMDSILWNTIFGLTPSMASVGSDHPLYVSHDRKNWYEAFWDERFFFFARLTIRFCWREDDEQSVN